jgi:uncharacterized protein (TIGR02145 family)
VLLALSLLLSGCGKKSGQEAALAAAQAAAEAAAEAERTASVEAENVASSVTYDTLTDARDGKKYKTVKIGKQVWMAENMNYEVGVSNCYNDSASYCDKYGRLYDWNTAKTVCPAGWKLPSNDDWNKLVSTAGGEETAGKMLKSTEGWNDYCDSEDEDTRTCFNCNGADEFGFSALPGGRYAFGDGLFFNDGGEDGYWWSINGGDSNGAQRWISGRSDNVFDANDEESLYSVRCIKK